MPLRHVVSSYVKNAAGRKVRQAAVDAARREFAKRQKGEGEQDQPQPEGEPEGPDYPPCDVGVVFALGAEAGGLEDLLGGKIEIRGEELTVRQGELEGRQVAVARSGPGREEAARATECLIDGHAPKWVLSSGFAGGLSPKLARHDLVMVDRLADVEGNRLDLELQVDREWLARTPGVHVGRLLTADRVVRLPDEKRSLGQKHEAVAVDMETFATAEVCRRRKVRFMAIRVISDAVDDELPEDIEKLLRQKTTAGRLGAAVGSIWRRPSSVMVMYRLRENALLASGKLARFLAGVIGGLPSS